MAAIKKEKKETKEATPDTTQVAPGQESPAVVQGGEAGLAQENLSKAEGSEAAVAQEVLPVGEAPHKTTRIEVPPVGETLPPPLPSPEKEKAKKKPKPFVVCAGKSVTSLRGILSEGDFVKEADFKGVTLKDLAKRGVIESA